LDDARGIFDMACSTVEILFLFGEVLGSMRRVVKCDARAPLVGPVAESWMVAREAFVTLLMANLASIVGNRREIELRPMVFAMTGCAGQFVLCRERRSRHMSQRSACVFSTRRRDRLQRLAGKIMRSRRKFSIDRWTMALYAQLRLRGLISMPERNRRRPPGQATTGSAMTRGAIGRSA
jgi:hypothetical protein